MTFYEETKQSLDTYKAFENQGSALARIGKFFTEGFRADTFMKNFERKLIDHTVPGAAFSEQTIYDHSRHRTSTGFYANKGDMLLVEEKNMFSSSSEFGPRSDTVYDIYDLKEGRSLRLYQNSLSIVCLSRRVGAGEHMLDEKEKAHYTDIMHRIADGTYHAPTSTRTDHRTAKFQYGVMTGAR